MPNKIVGGIASLVLIDLEAWYVQLEIDMLLAHTTLDTSSVASESPGEYVSIPPSHDTNSHAIKLQAIR